MNKKIGHLFANPFVSGGIYLMGSNVIIGVLNYLFTSLSGRLLSPAGFSDITALFSYVTLLTIPLTIASTVIIKKIGDAKGKEYVFSAALEKWTFEKLWQYKHLLVLVLLAIPFVPAISNMSPEAGYVLIPLVLLTIFMTLYDGVLQGLHLFMWFSVMGIVTALVKLSGVWVGWGSTNPLSIIVVFVAFSYALRVVLSRRIVRNTIVAKKKHPKLVIEKTVRSVLKDTQVRLASVSLAAIVVFNNMPMVIAKQLLSSHDAGLFGAWLLFSKILLFVFGPLMMLGYIFFASSGHKSSHTAVLIRSMIGLVLLGLGFVGVYMVFPEHIITLYFGPEYIELSPYMVKAAILGSSTMAIMLLNNYFLAYGSRAVYLFALSVGVYCIGLFTVPDIESIMSYSLYVTLGILLVYVLAFIRDRE